MIFSQNNSDKLYNGIGFGMYMAKPKQFRITSLRYMKPNALGLSEWFVFAGMIYAFVVFCKRFTIPFALYINT